MNRIGEARPATPRVVSEAEGDLADFTTRSLAAEIARRAAEAGATETTIAIRGDNRGIVANVVVRIDATLIE